jgi:hypothetical protein
MDANERFIVVRLVELVEKLAYHSGHTDLLAEVCELKEEVATLEPEKTGG